MINSKEKVIEFLTINGSPFWYLRRSEKSDPIFTSGDSDDITLEESIARLNKCMDMLGVGTYFIEAWNSKGQTKMRQKDTFVIGSTDNNVLQNSFIAALPQPTQNIDEAIAVAMEKYKTQLDLEQKAKEIAELKKENKELRTELDSAQTRIMSRLSPHIGGILEGLGFKASQQAQTPISGIKEQQADEAQRRLEAAFEKWAEKEPDCVLIVEKIAQMCINDPSTYAMAKGMLLNQNE